MKTTSRRTFSALLALALTFGLFAAISLAAGDLSAEAIIPPHQPFSVLKHDEYNHPLEGAAFRLVPDTDQEPYGDKQYDATSDADGLADFGNVMNGHYTLSEITAPDGYIKSNDICSISILWGGGIMMRLPGSQNWQYIYPEEPLVFINTAIQKIEFYVRKEDGSNKNEDGSNKPLAGAVITLVPVDGQPDYVKTVDATTNEEGIAYFYVACGNYIIKEKTAPTGYIKTTEEYRVEIDICSGVRFFKGEDDEELETVTFINTKMPDIGEPTDPPRKSFKVKKTDESGAPLAGAVITLVPDSTHEQASTVKTYDSTTNAQGEATFSVTEGYYVLSEKQAPAGYNATDDKYNISVTPNGVYLTATGTVTSIPYAPVTFVNKLIPTLNKDDHIAYMQGYPTGTFQPEKNMTRAEAVVMFSRLLLKSMDAVTDYRNNFYPDVKPTEWFANQVGYMQALGVLADYSRDGYFRPNVPVTRAEFATLAAHFDNLTLAATNDFVDVPNDHWAVKYINSAAAKGWINGYIENGIRLFRPESNIKRSEVVTLVDRMLNRAADASYLNANAASLPRTYSDVAGHWAYLDIMESSTGHKYDRKPDGSETWTSVYK